MLFYDQLSIIKLVRCGKIRKQTQNKIEVLVGSKLKYF